MAKSIAIIGGGIAGLAAGCYAQMNGYDSRIFELHDIPGGLCTSWDRKGYTFDGCLHYLFGTAPGQAYNNVWQELGALIDRPVIHHEELLRVNAPDGRTLITYCDPERLSEHMKALAPTDARLIDSLADGIRQFMAFDMSVLQEKPRALMGPTDGLKMAQTMLPYVLPLARWGRVSAAALAQRFTDPFLRATVPHMFGWPEIPVMAGLSLLAYMYMGNAGFPQGGSLSFAQAIERRYRELGGTIHYKAQVERILVEDDRAVGVRLYDDSEHRADIVISAADGRGTIYHMLDGKYTSRQFDRLYDGHMPLLTQVQVSLGIARELRDAPHWVINLCDTPVTIGGEPQHEIGIKAYGFDPTLAPAGKSSMVVMLRAHYPYWSRIYGRRLYDIEQAQVAEQVIGELAQCYPGIGEDVEVVDVATPLSYERYTGNWLGSTCGWLLTNETMGMMIRGLPKTLPKLQNFYMAGHWVEPGGSVPIVAMSARNVLQLICAADGKPFQTATVSAGTSPMPAAAASVRS
ncbi:MAG: NAD(P)/FAD-dependent oxidoreductase [Caldilineaceae bacterium]|nr:NAD(P)/FAD-dependent oxidoreductase [Caldilineaceae bacterium]